MIRVVAITVTIAFAPFIHDLEFPVGFFKLRNLHGQLRIAIVMLMQCTSMAWVALRALPCKGLF